MDKTDIFNDTLAAVAGGARVRVSLDSHCLQVNGCDVINQGQWQGKLGVPRVDEATALAMIEQAFATFECSVPAHDGRDRSRWFAALDEDQLTDRDLVTGQERPRARARLELLTLSLIINGSLTPDGPQMQGRWFWQSKAHPRLVILTQWLKCL